MTKLNFWQVDAFTSEPFKGNPAAVFMLDTPLEDSLMHNIAIEMNLSETAFVELRPGQNPYLRWFTPMDEIDLCGHATLASAHIYFTEINPKASTVTFDTKFVGPLTVTKNGSALTMDFPARPGQAVALSTIPEFVLASLSAAKPLCAFQARDLMLVYEQEETIVAMQPNFTALRDYPDFIIVTAKSRKPRYDFISRFFCAADGILEDPVTGSAHCTLAPYWSQQLNKSTMLAYQASRRGGTLNLEMRGERLNITGQAITMMSGHLHPLS